MEIKFRSLTSNEDEETFKSVSLLFEEMYSLMEEMGSNYGLDPKGSELWIKSLKSSLNKLQIIHIASSNEKIVGFVAGHIKISPTYLSNKLSGYISYLYVIPEYRRSNVAFGLVQNLLSSFIEKKVYHIELEVLKQNKEAQSFLEKVGFEVNSIRMVKKIKNEDF